MSVELVLVGTHRGAARETESPLTGLPETRTPLVMNEAEFRAFTAVLERYGVEAGTHRGRVEIEKTTAHLAAIGIEGATANIAGDVVAASAFLFELVTAGELLVLQQGRCIGTTEGALARVGQLDEEFGVAAMARDAASFGQLLARGAENTARRSPSEFQRLDWDWLQNGWGPGP